jgi:hypothetical protein
LEEDDFIQIDTTTSYEGESYINTYLFGVREDNYIFEAHHTIKYEDFDIAYEMIETIDYFNRNGTTIYVEEREFIGDITPFYRDNYYTIDQTDSGYLVTTLDFYKGSFLEFLFDSSSNKTESINISHSTIFREQKSKFSSDYNLFFNTLDTIFYTVPVYME